MKRLILYSLLITMIMIIGCEGDSPLSPDQTLPVIRAYIYAGEPVNDIQITETISLGSDSALAPPVNNAQVWLLQNGLEYTLVPSPGDSGFYHYDGDDLLIQAGDELDLKVDIDGRVATARTIVPPAPENVVLSRDTLEISSDFFGPGMGMGRGYVDSISSIIVDWKGEPDALYYVVLEVLDENPEAIESFFPGGGLPMGRRRFLTPPLPFPQYIVSRMELSYYGQYQVRVYRVNQEYADLYDSRQQDSRDLNEPLSNVENGLGVFSAFNSTSKRFFVVAD